MVYKVSYVVAGGGHPGAILNAADRPRVGDRLTLGEIAVEVVEVVDLMPPRGEFGFLHVTCRKVGDDAN